MKPIEKLIEFLKENATITFDCLPEDTSIKGNCSAIDEVLWSHIKSVEYLQEDFTELPFAILCTIARNGIKVTDYETNEPLVVPSHIWSAINASQLRLAI